MNPEPRARARTSGFFKRLLAVALPACLLAGAAVLYWQAAALAPTVPYDEALWLHRSMVPPSDISDSTRYWWAIDIPGMNRWAYYAALKVTGFDHVPEGEPEAWSIRDGLCCFQGKPILWAAGPRLQQMHYACGYYTPRRSILLMRAVNLAAFFFALSALWLCALWILRSRWLALLAVTPLLLAPVLAMDIAFITASGDVFLLAWCAATLAAWLYFHSRGRATSPRAVVIIGILAGMATASKHPGVLVAVAYAAYLTLSATGARRMLLPVLGMGIAFAAFSVVNPVILAGRFEPWEVCRQMMARRAEVAAKHIEHGGGLSYAVLMKGVLSWWPLLPLAVYAMWRARRAWWFQPVALWACFLVVGIMVGLFLSGDGSSQRYMAPVEVGLLFLTALCFLWRTNRATAYGGAQEPAGAPRTLSPAARVG